MRCVVVLAGSTEVDLGAELQGGLGEAAERGGGVLVASIGVVRQGVEKSAVFFDVERGGPGGVELGRGGGVEPVRGQVGVSR